MVPAPCAVCHKKKGTVDADNTLQVELLLWLLRCRVLQRELPETRLPSTQGVLPTFLSLSAVQQRLHNSNIFAGLFMYPVFLCVPCGNNPEGCPQNILCLEDHSRRELTQYNDVAFTGFTSSNKSYEAETMSRAVRADAFQKDSSSEFVAYITQRPCHFHQVCYRS